MAIGIQNPKDLDDLEEMIERNCRKLAFIGDFFGQPHNDEISFSRDGLTGIQFIVRDMQDELNFVLDQFLEKRKKGLIVEKEKR